MPRPKLEQCYFVLENPKNGNRIELFPDTIQAIQDNFADAQKVYMEEPCKGPDKSGLYRKKVYQHRLKKIVLEVNR